MVESWITDQTMVEPIHPTLFLSRSSLEENPNPHLVKSIAFLIIPPSIRIKGDRGMHVFGEFFYKGFFKAFYFVFQREWS